MPKVDRKLLRTLPKEITLAGFAISRSVYLNGKLITPEKSLNIERHIVAFDWGYKGTGPAQLALAILCEFMSIEDPESVAAIRYLYQTLKITFIAQLEQGNFHVKFKLKEFILALAGYSKKPRPATDFFEYLPIDFTMIKVGGYAPRGEVDMLRTAK